MWRLQIHLIINSSKENLEEFTIINSASETTQRQEIDSFKDYCYNDKNFLDHEHKNTVT